MPQLRLLLLAAAVFILAACSRQSSDPGPLAGTWKSSIGTTVEFRKGESVADGTAKSVSYLVNGNEVKVIHKEGSSSATFTLIDPDTAQSDNITLKREK
jgi:hypothetical protein